MGAFGIQKSIAQESGALKTNAWLMLKISN